MVHLCGKRYAQRAGETTEIRVYSNQPEVTLYINGNEIGTQQADKVFVFDVALEEGFNTIIAKAGELTDSMTLEKVEQEPSIYVLPGVNERAEGVANWFQTLGDLDLKAPMEFPEGMYSVKDTMMEIANNTEAFDIVAKAIAVTMKMELAVSEGMWDMVKTMTPESMAAMAGSLAPDGFLEGINAQLIKIKK